MFKPSLIVFGHFDNYASAGSVSRGLLEGLQPLKEVVDLYYANIRYAVNEISVEYGLVEADFSLTKDSVTDLSQYAKPFFELDRKADFGLFYGYPPIGACLRNYLAAQSASKYLPKKWLGYLICESSKLPVGWVPSFLAYDQIFTPSNFVRDALFSAFKIYTGTSLANLAHEIIWHGLNPIYLKAIQDTFDYADKDATLYIGHLCGTPKYYDRKGTLALINAFIKFSILRKFLVAGIISDKKVILNIRLPMPSFDSVLENMRDRAKEFCAANNTEIIFEYNTRPMKPEQMVEWYRKYILLVQPSRAEAFGLTPLECSFSGVPVLVTANSGHAVYARDYYLTYNLKNIFLI